MSKARAAAIAAIVTSLIAAGGTPARADDGTPLAVASTGLSDGQMVGVRNYLYPTISGDDITSIEVLVNGAVRRTATTWASGIYLTLWPALNDTDVDITVRAYDEAGDSAESTTRVHVDTVFPTATFSPADGAIVRGDSVTFAPTAMSDDVAKIAVTDLSGNELASTTSAPWSLTWALPSTGDLVHLFVRVTDRAGNWISEDLRYRSDNVGPSVTVDWPDQTPDVVGTGLNPVWATAQDVSDVDHVEWWVDGVLASQTDDLYYDFGRTTRIVPMEFRAWDKLGNESIHSYSVYVDATAPTVSWVSPASGALIRGSRIYSQINASDRSGIDLAWLMGDRSGGVLAPYSDWTNAGDDGAQTITWIVDDKTGHETVVRRTVIVDNTKPKLTVTKAPKSGSKVKGTVKVTASAGDRNGINRVELLINGKIVARDVKAGYAFSINTAKYGKTFKVQLRAYDKAGNATTTATRTWHR